MPDERAKVEAFAKSHRLEIIADIPRSDAINEYEDRGMTVIEGDKTLPISREFLELAARLLPEQAEQ